MGSQKLDIVSRMNEEWEKINWSQDEEVIDTISDDTIKEFIKHNLKYIKNVNLQEKYQKEPIELEEQRMALFPLKYPDMYHMYKDMVKVFWTLEEIDFSQDKWDELNDNYKWFIKHILAFFAGADTIVNLNILDNFAKEVPIVEAQMCYSVIAFIECIHSETYSTMIKTYIKDTEEQDKLFNACKTFPCVKKQMDWAKRWMDPNSAPLAHRIFGFVIVEGLFFSGSFCAIYWLKEQNLLPGLTVSNEFIARDEGMHCQFGCHIYNILNNRFADDDAKQIMMEAVDIVKEFIIESLPCKLIGMNSDLMSTYIEYVADRLMLMLNYEKIYNSVNPFNFMVNISINKKENFFEGRATNYSKAHGINSSLSAPVFTSDF